MTAVALAPLSPARESAASHLRDCLQILMRPDDQIDELDLAAVRDRIGKAIEDIDVREAAYRAALELIRERDTELARLQDRHDELRTFAAELTSVGTRIHIDHEKREYSLLRQYERPVLTSADWRVICSAQRELLALAKTLTGGRAAGRGDD